MNNWRSNVRMIQFRAPLMDDAELILVRRDRAQDSPGCAAAPQPSRGAVPEIERGGRAPATGREAPFRSTAEAAGHRSGTAGYLVGVRAMNAIGGWHDPDPGQGQRSGAQTTRNRIIANGE